MDKLQAIASTSPIIVCGNPRSGTRMHANVLNAHPEILITDEFHNIQQMRVMLANLRKAKLLKKFTKKKVIERQAFLAKMIWLTSSVDSIAERGMRASIIGNKTPLSEWKYKDLEIIFKNSPPKYVYCLRNAPKVLRSVKNLPNLRWNRQSVEVNLERYLKSIRCMEEMRNAFPDRVHVSILDRLPESDGNSAFFRPMFDFVGVELRAEVCATIDSMVAQNTMEAVRRAKGRELDVPVELTGEEIQVIARSRDYVEVAERYGLDVA